MRFLMSAYIFSFNVRALWQLLQYLNFSLYSQFWSDSGSMFRSIFYLKDPFVTKCYLPDCCLQMLLQYFPLILLPHHVVCFSLLKQTTVRQQSCTLQQSTVPVWSCNPRPQGYDDVLRLVSLPFSRYSSGHFGLSVEFLSFDQNVTKCSLSFYDGFGALPFSLLSGIDTFLPVCSIIFTRSFVFWMVEQIHPRAFMCTHECGCVRCLEFPCRD